MKNCNFAWISNENVAILHKILNAATDAEWTFNFGDLIIKLKLIIFLIHLLRRSSFHNMHKTRKSDIREVYFTTCI